jgi:hypothetical protein
MHCPPSRSFLCPTATNHNPLPYQEKRWRGDDSNVPCSDSRACEQRLKSLGKSVTLVTVPTGNHYQSMIDQGIPRAIEWLKQR